MKNLNIKNVSIIESLFEKINLVIDIYNIFVFIYIKLLDMINSIVITLLLVSLVAYKRLKRKKRQFHAPPTNQLPS